MNRPPRRVAETMLGFTTLAIILGILGLNIGILLA